MKPLRSQRDKWDYGVLKEFIRTSSPGIYDGLVKVRSGRLARVAGGFWERRRVRKAIMSGRPIVIDICGRMGFGATLTNTVNLHYYFEARGVDVFIVSSNPLYTDVNRPDMISSFLIRNKEMPKSDYVKLSFRFEEDIDLKPLGLGLTINKANEIFRREYDFQEYSDQSFLSLFDTIDEKTLAIHFRGSDKLLEAERVSWNEILQTAKHIIRLEKIETIFVASDEYEFISYLREKLKEYKILNYNCKYFSNGLVGAHFIEGDAIEKGVEALNTIKLLEKCNICIRGSSHLSAWAKILNPSQKIIMLNQSRSGSKVFPEGQIFKEYLEEPFVEINSL